MHFQQPYAKSFFGSLASKIAHWMGHPIGFVAALGVIVVWAALGPMFHFTDTWQLVINTGTTIVTFLMVFLIQNTQNRDSRAIQIKLDELIRSAKGAPNALLDLEELTEDELMRIREQSMLLAQQARENLTRGMNDTGRVDLPGSAEAKKSL